MTSLTLMPARSETARQPTRRLPALARDVNNCPGGTANAAPAPRRERHERREATTTSTQPLGGTAHSPASAR